MRDWLKGKKTYFIAAIAGGIGIAKAFGVDVPTWIWPVASALGLGALRAGFKKGEEVAAEAKDAVNNVYEKLEVED